MVTCVIGLGYFGLLEAISFAQAGYRAIGIDINQECVHEVNPGSSYIPDVNFGFRNSEFCCRRSSVIES